MKRKKQKYNVYLYPQAFVYKVEAESKDQAELIAVNRYNGGQYEDIYKTKILKLINSK